MFSMTCGSGMSMGRPDVCMTPPFAIPAPFPDIANNGVTRHAVVAADGDDDPEFDQRPRGITVVLVRLVKLVLR